MILMKVDIIQKFKSISKAIARILIIFAVLGLIYYGVDFAFKALLSSTSRAVLSNFILFALIIALVMKNIVHPKAILEQAQSLVEKEIKDSENAKDDSETRLDAIQKSARNVKKEINTIIKKSEENAKLVGEKMLQDAEKKALTLKENSIKAIENSQVLLKNDLIKRASLASVEVAKLHIIKELEKNVELHDKLINDSIEALTIEVEDKVEEV
jgi:F0F1-type ATP synthase membrane subunit b/b'